MTRHRAVGAALAGIESTTWWSLRRLGYGRMFVRCKWCQPARITRVKLCYRAQDGQISDGICDECLQAELARNGLEPYVPPQATRRPWLSGRQALVSCFLGTLLGVATMGGIVLCA